MPKYRKKPVVVEAVQWTGENFEEVEAFFRFEDENALGELIEVDETRRVNKVSQYGLEVLTTDGVKLGYKGDYIFRKGKDIDIVSEDIFESIWEAI